jgi:hypothetical protein
VFEPGEPYRFRIVAYNSKSNSALSKVVSIQLPSDQERSYNVLKLSSPKIISILCSNTTSTTVLEWEATKKQYTGVEGFKIFYVETDDDETPTKQFIVDSPSAFQYTIAKTRVNTHFYVYMQAYNGKTFSSYSKRHYCPSKEVAISQDMPTSYSEIEDKKVIEDSVSDRDIAFLIAGATFVFIALSLATSGIFYRKALASQLKQVDCKDGNSKQFHSQICAKVVNHIKKTQLGSTDPFPDDRDDPYSCQISDEMLTTEEYYRYNLPENQYFHHQQTLDTPDQTQKPLYDFDNLDHCMATGMASLHWPGTMFGQVDTKKDDIKDSEESSCLVQKSQELDSSRDEITTLPDNRPEKVENFSE